MRLAKLNNQSAEFKNLRNHSIFKIMGTADDAALIYKIDGLIGAEVFGSNAAGEEITWYRECCDSCAEYSWGEGCGWVVDNEHVEEFKKLWKKYKKAS